MELFLQSVVNGLIQGGFFSLFAVGLVLIFGVMRVVNFAHGELVMVGAFTVWLLHAQFGLGYIPALGAAIILVTSIGLVMERILFRPTRSDPLAGLICSIGVLFILQVIAAVIGGDGPSKQVPPPYHGTLILFDMIRVPYQRVFSLVISSSALIALWFFLTRSKFGWALRAVAMDREAASLQGIDANKISIIAIGVGAALAGLAGGLIAPLGNINPHMGHNVIVTAFIVTIVGGVGSLSGAVLAAVLYAMFHTIVTVYFGATIATICGLVLMVGVLIVKPTGIMGVRVSE
ncbi:MAG: branched-chain amino acid ABC transporter permease [Rhodospirillales bacterium]|jgi:branched-chain amino acid transport system permease protein|nr:branched-chain amino acid ABC transporter permease [Rhodospirillales bacterium]MBT4039209.1 branched-chain amino acid ABC transporter permease [Rhodospirillales bacterium]MBT4625870.1 branched-chain amino acid ABC transporter permease [Rhodospirillales bacterium]MBT5350538.1 branched-chain amino acid ABC transporter permease [Rhodospirillales bacterium]MBT5522195.1 branched-chain amino acid ABC transporter permease [Rhodospirillales bacterium]